MSGKVSRREIEANAAAAAERNGTAGLVQCEGCPAGVLVHGGPGWLDGLCDRHRAEVAGSAHGAELDRYEYPFYGL